MQIIPLCEGLFLCSKENNGRICKDLIGEDIVWLPCSKHGKLNIYTVGPTSCQSKIKQHFTNMAAWSLSKCLTHWHPTPVFVLFLFFCISHSAYFFVIL